MAGSFYNNNNDSMDISELAALNNDISDDLIEQLQAQLSGNMSDSVKDETQKPPINVNDDTTLFEESSVPVENAEPQPQPPTPEVQTESIIEAPPEDKKETVSVNTNFDDNFIKKYKAKLNKKASMAAGVEYKETESADTAPIEPEDDSIENISQGNISENPLTQELKDYNDSLDFLDGNVKYSKYVIYIDPQNVDFIDGLTVKERKNLINNILRQQDDIAMTKQRLKIMQTIIRQVIIAVLTVAISIPAVYYAINACLEATIDNHRRSQTNWQTLYKEHGKITNKN